MICEAFQPEFPPPGDVEPPGVTVFFIAAKCIEADLKAELVQLLEDQGHEALLVADIESTQTEAAAAIVSFCVDKLATAVVAVDLLPMSLDANERRKYPGYDNPKIPKAIERARHLVRGLAPGLTDPLAATRSSMEAWKAVRLLFAEKEEGLREVADRMRSDFSTDDAIRDLTREGRRAKVELVEFNGELAIRKTYRPTAIRYMEREIEVLQRLSRRPELPKLLHRGTNHIIISYIEGGRDLPLEHRGGRPTPLPLTVVRALADFIKVCVIEGFDPIDLRAPGNVMMTGDGLRFIDFELWRHCRPGSRPEDALCLTGVPPSDTERPRGAPSFSKSYQTGWYPLTLLSLQSFLYDPPGLQRLKRSANLLRKWGSHGLDTVKRVIRQRFLSVPKCNPRYIPAELGVDGLISDLNRLNVRYVVLRWFEDLPALPAGGDLDLLVHDDDIDKVDRLFDAKAGTVECDVYSVSGLPGTAYSGVPHLPPGKAAELLDAATIFNGMYRTPSPENYFLSLAFHSVYHKGFKTGLPSNYKAPPGISKPKNDYTATLEKLVAELGLEIELTLEGLDRFLARSGWQTTPKMLSALARRNAWIAAHFGEQRELSRPKRRS